MEITGGCYCSAVRYRATGEALFHGQCHCRECQYFSGGNPNVIIGFPTDSFAYTRGEPKDFFRRDLEDPAHREFCPDCGTHLITRRRNGMAILKVGTLDDPSVFKAQFAIQTADAQPFHTIPTDIAVAERWLE